MKKLYIIPSLAIATMTFFSFQSTESGKVEQFVATKHLFSGGGQTGLTGAPTEGNCTQCHNGSVLDGTNEHQFQVLDATLNAVSNYSVGAQYTVSLQLTSDPAKKGFSATVVDGSGTMAGTFTGSGIGGTQDFSGGGRDYVSHTASSNTSANTLWAWTWDAPATDMGDVTFYVASNEANDDGATNGDMIYLSQHTLGSTASISETKVVAASFKAGYAVEGNQVIVDFNSLNTGEMFFNLVDLNGRSVYTKKMSNAMIGANHQAIALPSSIENGIYVVNFFVDNKAMSAKIMVQK
jgi:hypothetical protein